MNPPLPSPLPQSTSSRRQRASSLWRWLMLSRGMQMVIDGVVAVLALALAHLLRFNGLGPYNYQRQILFLLPYVFGLQVAVNSCWGVYLQVWKYASIPDLQQLALSCAATGSALLALRLWFSHSHPILALPFGAIALYALLALCGMAAVRLWRRLKYERSCRAGIARHRTEQRVLLVGAGRAGVLAARELSQRPDLGMVACGFVDDDPEKLGRVIHGVKVLANTSSIPEIVAAQAINQVVIAMASAPRRTIRRVVDLCEQVPVPVRIVPGLFEILNDTVSISNFRPVQIDDLLGREAVGLAAVAGETPYCAGRRVLVTGGAGSIGRELCRQLIGLEPAAIYLFDKDENSVFEALNFLQSAIASHHIPVVPVVGDLRLPRRLDSCFAAIQPEIVFHAAAHKHVPLMEANACEAVVNNLLGTMLLLQAAERHQVSNCVMVSTDKAVNPVNIMGATKRIAELLFQAQARRHAAGCYSCVRFGNVLGSRGSVVPIFHEQIRKGGPVTVTDPAMTRYFMTIAEAAQLILKAGSLGRNGEIFLLDMGEPVRILDLAQDMIRLSGLKLGDDIEIRITGLRPGEKLREELFRKDEVGETRFEKIFVAAPAPYDLSSLQAATLDLIECAQAGNEEELRRKLAHMTIGFGMPLASALQAHA